MNTIFTDSLKHKKFGNIHVYWAEHGKIRQVHIGERPHIDIMAIPSNLKNEMPEVYEYLMNYGRQEPSFKSDILDFGGCSNFTTDVYKTLFTVPVGRLVTYGELASMAGYPKAARAAGSAMRKNRHLLLLPCHRVVGANSPGGFTTGMATKKMLLENEGIKWKW